MLKAANKTQVSLKFVRCDVGNTYVSFGCTQLITSASQYTFVAFFIFIGNMGRIDWVKKVLEKVLAGNELFLGFAGSQVISNVPAAILLSGFTKNYAALLQGVNIGGLGTMIASLASLISYKFYAEESEKNKNVGTKGKYFWYFTGWNLVFAAVLLTAAVIGMK